VWGGSKFIDGPALVVGARTSGGDITLIHCGIRTYSEFFDLYLELHGWLVQSKYLERTFNVKLDKETSQHQMCSSYHSAAIELLRKKWHKAEAGDAPARPTKYSTDAQLNEIFVKHPGETTDLATWFPGQLSDF
jgi:hypothetical protein